MGHDPWDSPRGDSPRARSINTSVPETFPFETFLEVLRAYPGPSFFRHGLKIEFTPDHEHVSVYPAPADLDDEPQSNMVRPYVKKGGLCGVIMNRDLGAEKFDALLNAMAPAADRLADGFKAWVLSWERQGTSALYVAQNDGLRGRISLADFVDMDAVFNDDLIPMVTGHVTDKETGKRRFEVRQLERL